MLCGSSKRAPGKPLEKALPIFEKRPTSAAGCHPRPFRPHLHPSRSLRLTLSSLGSPPALSTAVRCP